VLRVNGGLRERSTERLTDVGETPELDKGSMEHFRTVVLKLLYLSKGVRPDMLNAVTFLSTRVHKPTERDATKLEL
jgi:hypothetical protein